MEFEINLNKGKGIPCRLANSIGKKISGTILENTIYMYGYGAINIMLDDTNVIYRFISIGESSLSTLYEILLTVGLFEQKKSKLTEKSIIYTDSETNATVEIELSGDASDIIEEKEKNSIIERKDMLLYCDAMTRTFNYECFYINVSNVYSSGISNAIVYDPMDFLSDENIESSSSILDVKLVNAFSVLNVASDTTKILDAICFVADTTSDMSDNVDSIFMRIVENIGIKIKGASDMKRWFMRIMGLKNTDYAIYMLYRYNILGKLIPEMANASFRLELDNPYVLGNNYDNDLLGDTLVSLTKCNGDVPMKCAILFGKLGNLKSLQKNGLTSEENGLAMAESYMKRIKAPKEFANDVLTVLKDRVVSDGLSGINPEDVSYLKTEAVRADGIDRYFRMLKYSTCSRNDIGNKLAFNIIDESVSKIVNYR